MISRYHHSTDARYAIPGIVARDSKVDSTTVSTAYG